MAPYRWRRNFLRVLGRRRWYEESLALWLVSRSYLRYLPFPYPSVSTVQAWILQGETMVAQQVLPACHHGEALKLQRYTAKNLIELQRFRDRIGWRMAFVED